MANTKASFCSKTYLTSFFKLPGDLQNRCRYGTGYEAQTLDALSREPLLGVIS